MTDTTKEIRIYKCIRCGYEIIEDEVFAANFDILQRCIRCGAEGSFEIITREVKKCNSTT